jgi:copper transport protein
VNSIELTLSDAAGKPLVPVAVPELTVTQKAMGVGPLDRPLSRTGPGRYEAIADFPLAGTWSLALSVRTTTFDYPTAEFTVEIR